MGRGAAITLAATLLATACAGGDDDAALDATEVTATFTEEDTSGATEATAAAPAERPDPVESDDHLLLDESGLLVESSAGYRYEVEFRLTLNPGATSIEFAAPGEVDVIFGLALEGAIANRNPGRVAPGPVGVDVQLLVANDDDLLRSSAGTGTTIRSCFGDSVIGPVCTLGLVIDAWAGNGDLADGEVGAISRARDYAVTVKEAAAAPLFAQLEAGDTSWLVGLLVSVELPGRRHVVVYDTQGRELASCSTGTTASPFSACVLG